MTRAFTLLELLVAVLLLALIAGVSLVSLDGLTAKTRLEASSRCIEQAVRLARSEAIASGLPRRLVFDPQAHAVFLWRPRVGWEGLAWTQGPRLAWSEHVLLALDEDVPAIVQDDAEGNQQILLSVWPDGVGQSCQLRLKEAHQQVKIVIGGLNVTSMWIQGDAKGAESSEQP